MDHNNNKEHNNFNKEDNIIINIIIKINNSINLIKYLEHFLVEAECKIDNFIKEITITTITIKQMHNNSKASEWVTSF